MRRYVIIGAGAVGGVIGGALKLAGREVVLIARGDHLRAIQRGGLTLATPTDRWTIPVRAVASANEAEIGADDIVVLAVKSQDTEEALASVPTHATLVCAQNGVRNERYAALRFARVYGMLVFSPLQHLDPGVVSIHTAPAHGGLDVGVHPMGTDALVDEMVADLSAAGFDAAAQDRIEWLKYGKLLTNLGNIVEALAGRAGLTERVLGALSTEAEACLAAAKIDFASARDVYERYGNIRQVGDARVGGSSWQSLARGRDLETAELNGEIVRLGEAHGVPTPVHRALVALSQRAVRERWAAGALARAELERLCFNG